MRDAAPSFSDLPPFCRTAFWVAAARDIESDRADALFHDPFLRQLTGGSGQDIRSARRGRADGRGLAIRTVVIDQMIRRAIDEDRVDTVVNLACGLDTRAFRCELPSSLAWFDVDLPPMIEYRRRRLEDIPPRCRYETIGADLLDPGERRKALERATDGSGVALVLTEGFLLYLSEGQVAPIAEDLARLLPVRYWVISVSRPRASLRRRRLLSGPDAVRGSFRPANGTGFFETFGFREREFRSTLEEGIRLGRPLPFSRLSLFLRRFQPPRMRERARRGRGVALLEAVRKR